MALFDPLRSAYTGYLRQVECGAFGQIARTVIARTLQRYNVAETVTEGFHNAVDRVEQYLTGAGTAETPPAIEPMLKQDVAMGGTDPDAVQRFPLPNKPAQDPITLSTPGGFSLKFSSITEVSSGKRYPLTINGIPGARVQGTIKGLAYVPDEVVYINTVIVNKENIHSNPHESTLLLFEMERLAARGTTFDVTCVRLNRWGIRKLVLLDVKRPETKRTGLIRINYTFLQNEIVTIPKATDTPIETPLPPPPTVPEALEIPLGFTDTGGSPLDAGSLA